MAVDGSMDSLHVQLFQDCTAEVYTAPAPSMLGRDESPNREVRPIKDPKPGFDTPCIERMLSAALLDAFLNQERQSE